MANFFWIKGDEQIWKILVFADTQLDESVGTKAVCRGFGIKDLSKVNLAWLVKSETPRGRDETVLILPH